MALNVSTNKFRMEAKYLNQFRKFQSYSFTWKDDFFVFAQTMRDFVLYTKKRKKKEIDLDLLTFENNSDSSVFMPPQ